MIVEMCEMCRPDTHALQGISGYAVGRRNYTLDIKCKIGDVNKIIRIKSMILEKGDIHK